MTAIIGAGLGGLTAAIQFPLAQVFESNGADSVQHRAVLRFRSDKLSRLTGIPFRRVIVRKSIFKDNQHYQPNVHLANLYSRKTNGGYLDRSIWNIDPVERFIAPEDIQQQMAEMVGNRISWNTPIMPDELGREPMISTMPMPIMMKMLHRDGSAPFDAADFRYASIQVDRFRIAGADIYQTIYYPSHDTAVYRASMTGSLLIIESMRDWDTKTAAGSPHEAPADMVLRSFGLLNSDITKVELGHVQRFGKISPVDDVARRQFIYDSTINHQVYALGRFATWRNILLDDVVDDVAVIKRLISHGHYSATLQHHRAPKE